VAVLSTGVIQAGGGGHYSCQNDKNVGEAKVKGQVEILMRDNCFGPTIALVAPGTTVRWTNTGQQQHNVVPMSSDGTPTLKTLQNPGGSMTLTLDQPGAFVYYCSMHAGMVGTVFVTGEGDDGMQQVSVAVAPAAPPTDPRAINVPSKGDVAQLAPKDSDGVPVVSILLLASIVGTIAGGGSMLLVRRLDRKPRM
jgi:plastocyanin